jgi:ABC-type transport system involved in cytochrome c biogenesis ATPase subunit
VQRNEANNPKANGQTGKADGKAIALNKVPSPRQTPGDQGRDQDRVAIEQNMLQRAHEDQMRQLGGAGTARLAAVATWLKSMAGEEGGKALIANLLTAKQVAAFEQMMHRHQSQGGGTFSSAHREPNQPERLSSEAYNRLSYTEKKQYAESASREQSTRR